MSENTASANLKDLPAGTAAQSSPTRDFTSGNRPAKLAIVGAGAVGSTLKSPCTISTPNESRPKPWTSLMEPSSPPAQKS